MQWVKRQDNFSIQHFSLLKDDATVLELKFYHQTNTARVEYNGRKRAFMIEEAGLFRNGIVFRNEYGVEIGYLHFEGSATEGYVQIEGEKFSFAISNAPLPEIVFYTSETHTPVATCALPARDVLNFSPKGNNRKSPLQSAMLLVIGWYLYVPVIKGLSVA
jgi:hypothetical protein